MVGVLLFAMFLQEPDVDALLKQLTDESIEVRGQAASGLIDLGDKVVERIKKELASADGEIKPQLEGILRAIARKRKLNEVLPALARVTIDAKDLKLREVLEDLKRQSGLAMNLEGLADAAISVQVKDAAPLEALNAICKAAGLGFQIDSYQSMRGRAVVAGGPGGFGGEQGEPTIRFTAGGYAEIPRVFVRHYQVEPSNVSMSQSSNFRTTTFSAQMNVQLTWPPGVKPDVMMMEINSVTDDKGRALYDAARNPGIRMDRPMRRGMYPSRSQWDQYVHLTYPAADARSIASVKGNATLKFVMEEKLLSFEAPETESAQKKEYDGVEVELREFKSTADTIQVKLVTTGRRKSAQGEGQGPGSFGNIDSQQVRLRMEDGSAPSHQGMSGRGDGKSYTIDLTYRNAKSKVVAIDIVMDTVYHEDKFEFELKDIPLPK